LKAKPSFSFRRKGSRASDASTNSLPDLAKNASAPPAHHVPKMAKPQFGGPTSAQSAYIARILSGPPGPPETGDPLARLRAANGSDIVGAQHISASSGTGLEDSLKAFTAVEVLEGENAFACKKCWKVDSGKYKGGHATVFEEDEAEAEADAELSTAPASPTAFAVEPRNAPPSISIVGSDSSSSEAMSPPTDDRLGRHGSMASRSSVASQASSLRAPSPLRYIAGPERSYGESSDVFSTTSSRSEADTTIPVSDGLSESDTSSDDEAPALSQLPVGRPKMPPRMKSKHFVLRRAFKRYLIAKAPEVLVFHFKRFKQTSKSTMTFSSFYNLKKWVTARW
jgi:ubiquitin carboxyl-terminal hydrolase 16/45